jgi:transposase
VCRQFTHGEFVEFPKTDAGARDVPIDATELEAENARLRRELADTKQDVEVLKKAAAYFARGSR